MKHWLLMFFLLAIVATSIHYRREAVRNSTNYADPLRYERMVEAGLSVDYKKEPLIAWKIVSGPKKLELTGGGHILTCMDDHLLLGYRFEIIKQPEYLGDALDFCKAEKTK